GKLMKTEFITVQKYFTVDEAIAHFRMTVNNKKNIHYIYAVNQDNVLCGVVSMKELLAAEGHERINKIMVKDIISVDTDLDQEDVAKIVEDKDLLSVPVVDEEHRMAGVVHVDDILDVVQKET
ncbi:CBS domain-containing protein, partial [Jeotgalibacillus marinus]